MITYSCLEGAIYSDKNGDQLAPEQAWSARKTTTQNGSDANTEITFEFGEDIVVEPNHSATISIQWRQPANEKGHRIFDLK